MKKLLLTFILLITAWATASAYDFMVDGIAYNFNSDGKSVTVTHNSQGLPILDCYSNYTGSISIPVTVTYEGTTYSVTSIDMMAFSRCTGLTSVTIPNSIKQIEQGAFKGCSGLTEVTIPKSVTLLYAQAFADCSKLTTVNFNAENCSHSDIVYDDGNDEYPSIFAGCPLKNLNIGDSVTKIPAYLADGQSGLTSVTIPNSVTSIGYHAFEGCSGLTSIVVASGNRNYDSRNNCNAIIETESNTLIQGCNNTVIPESVTSIGGKAFYGCRGLTSVTIPKSVTEIGNDAFRGCSGLTSIVVASGNRNYDSRNNCNAIIETTSNRLIIGCNNTVIPESVTRIGCSAFIGCSQMTEITIPSSVSVIEFEAGWDYDSGPESFYRSCQPFDGCTGLKKVNYDAIRCELVNDMPRGDEDYLPLFGSNLNTLNIGSSVQAIPNGLVSGCRGLTSVYNLATQPQNIDADVFASVPITFITLFVPKGCTSKYGNAPVWQDFGKIEELPAMPGDINNDSKVDIFDMNLLINYIHGLGEIDDIQSADLNEDFNIDIKDLNILINLILGI